MQTGFYFDQTRCVGCCTCIVACKDWHNIPAGPASWRRVITIEKGTYPDLFLAFLSTACHHCSTPACIPACPVDAITKRNEDGVVVVNHDMCLGKEKCSQCLDACPYDAPQFGAEENAMMQKCDFCFDRLSDNKKPICVDACPLGIIEIEERFNKSGVFPASVVHAERCTGCAICARMCPEIAIEVFREEE